MGAAQGRCSGGRSGCPISRMPWQGSAQDLLPDDDVTGVGVEAAAEPTEGAVGQVQALGFLLRVLERAPVVDAHDQGLAVRHVGYLHPRAERQLVLAGE